eukprot:14104441-Heterocapsa_arctica.AAC.1
MQVIDGDELIEDKECIRLQYCNKNKWGDAANHNDLMYPVVQQICKGKIYNRRSEVQQIEHKSQEDTNNTDNQRQTRFGEEHTKQTDNRNSEKLGPEEEGKQRRDCTTIQNMKKITSLKMVDCTKQKRRMGQ